MSWHPHGRRPANRGQLGPRTARRHRRLYSSTPLLSAFQRHGEPVLEVKTAGNRSSSRCTRDDARAVPVRITDDCIRKGVDYNAERAPANKRSTSSSSASAASPTPAALRQVVLRREDDAAGNSPRRSTPISRAPRPLPGTRLVKQTHREDMKLDDERCGRFSSLAVV